MTKTEATSQAANNDATPPKATGFSPRHLVNMGVFSAIYLVIVIFGSMGGFIGPVFSFVGFTIAILINGTVVMLYLAKTPVFGALTFMGLLFSAVMALVGHPWFMVPICVVLGIIGDLLVKSGGYRSRTRAIIAYGIFTAWYVVPLLPMVYYGKKYFEAVAARTNQAHADEMAAVFQPWIIYTWGVVCIILGLIGAWIGTKILTKHFVKAGLV